jgi:hypothetical protein
VAVALLLAVISIGGVVIPSAYARESPNWATQAIAQDWFDLVFAAPALLLAALWTARGSRLGQLALGGLLLFAIYTLLIYAFAVHLNTLFLVYCAALGLGVYSLIALARALDPEEVAGWFDRRMPRRAAGGFLVGVGVVFGALWLSQLIPAALTGREPAELAETGLLTNPVHVIDLSFILPLHILAGVWLWRRRPLGYVLAPIVLVFAAFMAASIGFLMLVMEARGISSGATVVAGFMIALAVSTLGFGVATLRAVHH